MKPRWTGFTVIEAALIFVLLGIFASIIIPRINLFNQKAHKNKIDGLRVNWEKTLHDIRKEWIPGERQMQWKKKQLYLNSAGWPTIDDKHLDQNTTDKLFNKIFAAPVNHHRYKTRSIASSEGGQAWLSLKPQCELHYDALNGQVKVTTNGC